MNLSATEIRGSALVVSQFTLYGDCRKGRRPGFDKAAPPDVAESLYNNFVKYIEEAGIPVSTGRFQATMLVVIENDGPVTLIVETPEEVEGRPE
jgi:D-tyrosyl-tRNA(Tyr) deacylase